MKTNKIRELLPDPDEGIQVFNLPQFGDDYFRRLPDDPLEQAFKAMKTYQERPLSFVKHELGIATDRWRDDNPPSRKVYASSSLPIWSKQREVLNALIKHKKVAVKSGHGVGKTRIASVAVMYLHYAWHALGITTAPTFRQVRRVLWGEIHDLYYNAPRKLGGKLYQTSLESGEKWFVEGFSTRDPKAAVTGFHEENIFVVIDEAGGVAQDVYDSIEGVLTSANSFVLLIGNPLDSASAFADAFKEDSEYYKITISCYDSPNVKHGYNIYPKLTSCDWPDKMKVKWGPDSNLFRVRVLGEFPLEGRDTLIPVKYINQAIENYKDFEETTPEKDKAILSFGVDVARMGMDSTVIGVRWINKKTKLQYFEILEESEKQRVDETVDKVMSWYTRLVPQGEQPPINIDDIGLGGGVTDYLLKQNFPVNGINVGETPDTYNESDEERFLNKRAFYYWNLRDMFANQQLTIDDDRLAFQLSKVGLDFTLKNKVKIEDKRNIRKKLSGQSPDLADCCMLACAEGDLMSAGNLLFFI